MPTGRRARTAVLATALVVATISATMAPAPPAAAESPTRYVMPVDAPIIERFRMPSSPWGAGNRGIDFDTDPGAAVTAAAPGEVVYAGFIGSAAHVVVLHSDGIRTSYSFLNTISVTTGDIVDQFTVVGHTIDDLHFGARAGDTYLDPLELFDDAYVRVELVPDKYRTPDAPSAERQALVVALGRRIVSGTGDAVRWVGGATVDLVNGTVDGVGTYVGGLVDEARLWVHYLEDLNPTLRMIEMGRVALAWRRDQATCTPASVVPPPVGERRIVVLVGGLGSDAGAAAVRQVDTAALGYTARDVVQFSYRGGAVPGVGNVDVPRNDYDASDTTGDLWDAGAHLRALLTNIRAAQPGVAVDLIAHSQGGLVVRAALDGDDHLDPTIPSIATIVTVATPHHGADAATALSLLGGSLTGAAAVSAVGVVSDVDDNLLGPATEQLSETSSFIRKLSKRDLPATTAATSIGAAGDMVVALPSTRWGKARHASVSQFGTQVHGDVVAHPDTQREMALAVTGHTPTCRGFGVTMRDATVGESISMSTDALGAAAGAATRFADGKVLPPMPNTTHTPTP